MKKLSVKEVVSSCCNTPITGVNINEESSAWCEKCGKPHLPSKTSQGNDYVEKKYAIKGNKLNSGSVKEVGGFDEYMSQGFHDHAIKFPEAENTQFESGFDVAQELAEKYLRQELAQAREERDKEIHEVILDILFSLDRDQSREYQRGVKVATSTIEMIVNKDLLASAERE